jgi:hypothetical protein
MADDSFMPAQETGITKVADDSTATVSGVNATISNVASTVSKDVGSAPKDAEKASKGNAAVSGDVTAVATDALTVSKDAAAALSGDVTTVFKAPVAVSKEVAVVLNDADATKVAKVGESGDVVMGDASEECTGQKATAMGDNDVPMEDTSAQLQNKSVAVASSVESQQAQLQEQLQIQEQERAKEQEQAQALTTVNTDKNSVVVAAVVSVPSTHGAATASVVPTGTAPMTGAASLLAGFNAMAANTFALGAISATSAGGGMPSDAGKFAIFMQMQTIASTLSDLDVRTLCLVCVHVRVCEFCCMCLCQYECMAIAMEMQFHGFHSLQI